MTSKTQKFAVRLLYSFYQVGINNISQSMAFSRGPNALNITAELFIENRSRLINSLRGNTKPKTAVLLTGGKETHRYNTDSDDLPFRQESYFFWTFGVHESDCYGVVDVDSGRSILFPPRLHPDFAIWHGSINDEKWFQQKYSVDEVHFLDTDTIKEVLKKIGAKCILLLQAENSDSGKTLECAHFDGIDNFEVDKKTLYPIIAELRVLKTDHELNVLRYVNKVSSCAHEDVMSKVKIGMYEYQLESVFRHYCYFHGGCRHLAYTCIVASGTNSSILHYGHANAPNDKLIADGDLCLLDMGPEYNCYASDITSTFPANGKFTDQQKIIYNAVLEANREVIKNAKPGIRWSNMHLLAERIILNHLKKANIVKGNIEDMLKARLGAIFMPHGLGHLIGLDVHDCGGYLGDADPRSTHPGLKSLRMNRTLKERMVITVEPGCYFIKTLIDKALKDADLNIFLNKEELDKYRLFGGVRIEDNIVIWEKENEILTTIPRTVEEIENFMSK